MKFDKNTPKVQRRITVLTVVLVILAGVVSSCIRGSQEENGFLMFHNDGYLSIQDHTGTVTNYGYGEMIEVNYVETMDVGEVIDGAILEGIRLGTWHSDAYGEYQACLWEGIPSCVFIRTNHGSCAINYESAETTKALYNAILKAREALGFDA